MKNVNQYMIISRLYMNEGNRFKKKGIQWENDLAKKLREVGFPLVMRSAGSKGLVDVVAFGWNDIYLFQCKSTESTVITNELVQTVMKNKSVKDLTNLPSRYIKILAFKAEGKKDIVFYRWTLIIDDFDGNTSGHWKYVANKLF